jgi:hypothetical protein
MTALPTVGGDTGNWGTVLNNYLKTEHSDTGTHGLSSGLVTDVVHTVSASGATQTIPAPTMAGVSDITLTASCTLTFPTAVAGQTFIIVFRQGGSGSYTITFPLNIVKWESGVVPTLTTTVGAVDILSFTCVDGTNWFGFVSGQDMK